MSPANLHYMVETTMNFQGPSEWVSVIDENVRNSRVNDFFENEWDGKGVQRRMLYYLRCTENDRDRLPIDGQCKRFLCFTSRNVLASDANSFNSRL